MVVKAVDKVRDLGAYFDSNMSMEKHIDVKCSSAFKALYSLRRIRKYLTRHAVETLVHSFIFSHLDYCNGLLHDVPNYLIQKMQCVQNMAARLVLKQSKFCHITPLLTELHWLPVEYRIQYKVLLLTFKGIQGTAPAYICDMFTVSTSRSSRSCTSIDDITFENGLVSGSIKSHRVTTLQVPKTKRVTFQARSLTVAGPVLWNSLPHALRSQTDLDEFKGLLKTHLFKMWLNSKGC